MKQFFSADCDHNRQPKTPDNVTEVDWRSYAEPAGLLLTQCTKCGATLLLAEGDVA